ncbi:MAG: Ni/Fe-hydrogenase, b-type cytochrome subunit [Methylocystaceae bacterium]
MVVKMEQRHPIWVRIFHWTNMISITLLILSGFYIHAPLAFRLFKNMDNARMLHFILAMVLCVGVVGRVYYALATKDYKNIWFDVKNDPKKFPSMIKYYTFFTDKHPHYGKYNPGQKMMYSGWLGLALIQIITGFVLYKPNTFLWLGGFLGGLVAVRLIHLVVTWLFVLSILAHVYLDISEGIPVLISMFTGKIPEGFEDAKIDHSIVFEDAHQAVKGESVGA